MAAGEELRERYWALMRRTRQSGRISPSLIERVERSWEQFDNDVVEEALRIHTSRYPSYRESYTLGIMRNLQRSRREKKPARQQGAAFNEMQRQDYNMDELEQLLISNK